MRKLLLLACMVTWVVSTAQVPVARFGIVTDIHYADLPDNGLRTYRQSLLKLQEFVDTMTWYKPDFIIELGDFKDISSPASEEVTLGFLRKTEATLDGFSGKRYHVLGNHDEDCISKSQCASIISNTGIPTGKTYYSFDKNNIHFIVLDACFDSMGNPYSKGNFKWSDANIPGEEVKWLKNDLATTHNKVIVFTHQLVDVDDKVYGVRNAKEIRKIMEDSHKVRAVFQGHMHEGKYTGINRIQYYTLRSLVEGKYPEGNSYALVEAAADGTIYVRGFRNAISMKLE